MKQWMKRPGIAISLGLFLGLLGLFAGYLGLAQGPQPSTSEREQGNGGDTGQLHNLTSEQLRALQSTDMTVLYHFAGAVNLTTSPEKATVIQCTNVDITQATEIQVQLFDYDLSDVYTGTIALEPQRTATFESSSIAFYVADVLMHAGSIEQGYGRILTEHNNVICTVQTLDPIGSTPAWSFDIPLYIGPFHNSFLPAITNNTAP